MERPRIRAHHLGQRERTEDAAVDNSSTFASLALSEPVLRGLAKAGFVHPSQIQARAIPLGKCGLDVVAQAKAGTGKTLVFATVALEIVDTKVNHPQVMVLAPTREIAFQIYEVLLSISAPKGAVCHCCIGGLAIADDVLKLERCHVVVGTPGRLQELAERQHLDLARMRLCVLDEADKLLSGSIAGQTRWLLSGLPRKRQLMAFSATYPEDMLVYIKSLMTAPSVVRLDSAAPALRGVRQFRATIADGPGPAVFDAKMQVLLDLLSKTEFQQCMVFTTARSNTEVLCEALCDAGWPAAAMSASQTQLQRIHTLDDLRSFRLRVLVSTDLTSRGIDVERVNLVVNFDIAPSAETHLHRVGRAGRFGSRGVCVTLCTASEDATLNELLARTNAICDILPESIPRELYGSGEADACDDKAPRRLTATEIEERRAARAAAAAEQAKRKKNQMKKRKAREAARRRSSSDSDSSASASDGVEREHHLVAKRPTLRAQPAHQQAPHTVGHSPSLQPVLPHCPDAITHGSISQALSAPHIQNYMSLYIQTLVRMHK